MALADRLLRRATTGSPSLRRQLAEVDSDRRSAFVAENSDLDQRRWRSLYRRNLRDFVANEQAAQPMRERVEMEQAQQEARASGNLQLADRLGTAIRESGTQWGSIAQRSDPNRYGSAAGRFSRLYRG